jgi:hypothetical protein
MQLAEPKITTRHRVPLRPFELRQQALLLFWQGAQDGG